MSTAPVGECVLTRIGRTGIRVDQADPVICIHPEIVDELRAGQYAPGVTFDGDVLRIHGMNRTVVYRLGELTRDPCGRLVYLAEWPD